MRRSAAVSAARASARFSQVVAGDVFHRLGDDRFLLIPPAVGDGFLSGQRAVLEGDDQLLALRPRPSHPAGQEEALLALDVVLLHVGGLEFEVHGDAAGGLVGVVGEVLAGLDVVLVVVGPVEIDLFAVVGDGVALAFGVAALADEVAVLVVAAEEGKR